MSTNKIIGIVLLVVGAVLLYFGYQASQSVTEQVVNGLTGRFTDKTTWYFIAGTAAAVAGLFLAVFKK